MWYMCIVFLFVFNIDICVYLSLSGGFAPAGPNTIWKKRYMKDNNETEAYESLMEDTAHSIVPVFYREVEYNSECILSYKPCCHKD